MLEEMTVGVLMQIIVGVGTVAAAFGAMRARDTAHTKASSALMARVDQIEKDYLKLLSRKEAEEHFVTKLQFEMTMENVSLKLGNIVDGQKQLFALLEKYQKER